MFRAIVTKAGGAAANTVILIALLYALQIKIVFVQQ